MGIYEEGKVKGREWEGKEDIAIGAGQHNVLMLILTQCF